MRNERKKRSYQTILGGLGLWILLALRSWTCGNDLYNEKNSGYIPYFIHFKWYSFKEVLSSTDEYERGYNVLNWIIVHFTDDPQVFLAVIAAIELVLIGYTLYRHSPNVLFSWIIYACLGIYIFSFSGLRQIIAISICFFSFNFLVDRKFYVFISLVLLSATIHTSAIIFLPAILVRNLSMSKTRAVLLFFIVILMIPFMMMIVESGSKYVYGYAKYASDEGGAYSLFILYVLLFFYSFLFKSDKVKQVLIITQVRWMIVLAILLQSVGIFSAGALARIAYYYSIFFCLLLPLGLKSAALKERQTHSLFLSILLIIFFILTNSSGYLNVVPYRFFWEEPYSL